MAASKSSMRKNMKDILRKLEPAYIERCSVSLAERLMNLHCVQVSKGLSCFLSMPTAEIRTDHFLRCVSNTEAQSVKQLFVPKVIGIQPQDMLMLAIKNLDCLDSFPKNKWYARNSSSR